jgi:alpha-galactosidase
MLLRRSALTRLLFAFSIATTASHAQRSALALTPPMGFNTWNKFGCDVSESLVRGMADAMVTSGMQRAGYRYVVIDDCWQVARDAAGNIVPDPVRFKSGMKALADYVHSRGLLFGIYSDAGTKTCEGRPGSYGHVEQDARTYAAWGVDYLKYDWCNADTLHAETEYTRMRDALRRTGRPIVLSVCEWGRNEPWDWGPKVSQLWRTTGDIRDNWESLTWIIGANERHYAAAGPGHWNDPDMLEVGNGGMSLTEYRTHFSMWAMMAAPLMTGNDLRAMSPEITAILTNAEVIAVDQDSLGEQGRIVYNAGSGRQVWAKRLRDGSRAVALLNLTSDTVDVAVPFRALGLPPGSATVRDLWLKQNQAPHTDAGVDARTRFSRRVPPHGVVMLKMRAAGGAEKGA